MKLLRANAPQQTLDEVDESLQQPDFGADWRPVYAAPSAARIFATTVGGARTLDPSKPNKDPLAFIEDKAKVGFRQFTVEDPRIVLAEQLSHCFLLESAVNDQAGEIDEATARWVHIATRYIQRGIRPLVGRTSPTIQKHWSYESVLAAILGPMCSSQLEIDPEVWGKLAGESPLQSEFLRALERDGISWLLRFGYPEASLAALHHDPLKQDSGQGRRCDWVFASRDGRINTDGSPRQKNLIVELDGASYHSAPGGADQRRDEQSLRRGYNTVRLRPEDLRNPDSAAWKKVKIWADVLRPAITKGGSAPDILDVWEPTAIARIRLGVVRAVSNGWLDRNSDSWRIRVAHDLPDWQLPEKEIASPLMDLWKVAGLGSMPRIVLDEHSSVVIDTRIGIGPFAPGLGFAPTTISFRSARFPTRPQFLELPSARGHGTGFPVADETAITSIAQDAFGISTLKPGQFEGIAHAFAGRSGMSVLPTSGGKSLIYWLASLCTAGLTIAIAPLRALIDDQESRLCNLGMDRVVATHAGRQGSDRGAPALALRRVPDTFLALMTPERLQRKRFRDKLQILGSKVGFAYIVVDEAHCVSQWGHDFRPAYLRVASSIRHLSRHDSGDGSAPLIALTATASPAVRQAAERDLGISAEDILQSGSTSRKEIRFQNWVFQGEKPAAERRRNAARALIRAGELLGIERQDWNKQYDASDKHAPAAIIFAQTKSGKSPMGVPNLHHALKAELNPSGQFDPVAVFWGGNDDDAEESADERVSNVQRFMSNQANIMISTKAFGMGIDKPNVRVTVHASMPASIEEFVQEAGRAGRDGGDAIGVLCGNIPPVESEVMKQILDPNLSAEQRKILAARLSARDDKDKKSDLDTILYFLHSNRPGEKDESAIADAVLDSLLESATPGLTGAVYSFDGAELNRFVSKSMELQQSSGVSTVWTKPERVQQFVETTLFRLTEIGFIADYSKEGYRQSETYIIDFAPYDVSHVRKKTLESLDALNVGKRNENVEAVMLLPEEVGAAIRAAVKLLIGALYGVILPSRIRGLSEMIRIALGPADRMKAELAQYMDGGSVREALSAYLASLVGQDAEPRDFTALVRGLPAGSKNKWRAEAVFMLQGPAAEVPAFRVFRALGEWAASDCDADLAAAEMSGALKRWDEKEESLATEMANLATAPELVGRSIASGVLTSWIRNHGLSSPAPRALLEAATTEGAPGQIYRIATLAQNLLDQYRAFAQ